MGVFIYVVLSEELIKLLWGFDDVFYFFYFCYIDVDMNEV